jgi:CBS domain-containing protein
VADVLARLEGREVEFLLLRQGRGLWSGVRRDRLRQAWEAGDGANPVGTVADATLPALHPDHPLESALRLVREWWPVTPVVHRANEDELVGVLSLEDVLRTYGRATS